MHLSLANDADRIARLVTAANALPGSVEVGWYGSCSMIPNPPPEFTVTFHTDIATVVLRQVLSTS